MIGGECSEQCHNRNNPCPEGNICKKVDGSKFKQCVPVPTRKTTTTTTMRSTTKKVQTIESTTATTTTTTIVTETILGLPKVIFYVAIIGASILLIGAIIGIILAVRSCKSTTGYDYSSGIKARGASLPMHRPNDGHGNMPETFGTVYSGSQSGYSGRTTLPHGADTTRSDSFRPIPPRTKQTYMSDYDYQ